MRYFTKEWYELCQKTHEHLLLEEDEQAESFCEEYFQQVYNQKSAEFLDIWEEVARISNKPFEKEKLTRQFEEGFIYNQERVKKVLPGKILTKIADIRVYVLNKASHQVIEDVTQFCEDNNKLVDRAIQKYDKYYKKAMKSFDKDMVNNINFHDCLITDIKQTEHSLTMLLDNSSGFTDIYEVQFENYNIIKQDASLEKSWWLYDEIYKTNGKYEVHVLLQKINMGLVEFTVSTDHISFKHSHEK